jgi:hypothetical protein
VVPLGSGTGERGDYVIVDDPHLVDQAESDAERQAPLNGGGSMTTRLNDFATGHKVVIQQRLHEADFTGDLLQIQHTTFSQAPPLDLPFRPQRASMVVWRRAMETTYGPSRMG